MLPVSERLRGLHIKDQSIFSRAILEDLFQLAHSLELLEVKGGYTKALESMVVAPLFFEASSRTQCSFMAATAKLGGHVLQLPIENSSHAAKGETLSDTVRTIGSYSDLIVLRHPDEDALETAMRVSRCPVINAGNGTGEHPTQALLDTFTIYRELGTLDGISMVLVGDLKHGRTVHSLIRLLVRCFQIRKLVLVAPSSLECPSDIIEGVAATPTQISQSSKLTDEIVSEADVIYMTRVQCERFPSAEAFKCVQGSYVLSKNQLARAAKSRMLVLHPLPRCEELPEEVDSDPRACYFAQMRYGLFARMALLMRVLGKNDPMLTALSVPRSIPHVSHINLSQKLLGFCFETPFMNAAGVWCRYADEIQSVLDAPGTGAAISKSCTLLAQPGNPCPRYVALASGNTINSMGLPNEGFSYYVAFAKRHTGTKPLFISTSGKTLDDTVHMSRELSKLQDELGENHPLLFELNLSCPNLPGKPQLAYDFLAMTDYLTRVSAVYHRPFGVKLPPYFDPSHFDEAAEILNRFPTVAFLTCINSIGNGLVIDEATDTVVIKPKGGLGGLGGPGVLATSLANVNAFAQRCPDKVIIGCGGVSNGSTALMHILAGASLIQIGSHLAENGVVCFATIAKELKQEVAQRGYDQIHKVCGTLKPL